jgi:hypothetical protein
MLQFMKNPNLHRKGWGSSFEYSFIGAVLAMAPVSEWGSFRLLAGRA